MEVMLAIIDMVARGTAPWSVPIHMGALIADYGGWLLCGLRGRSSIELVRGALGLIRRRQNSARRLILSNF